MSDSVVDDAASDEYYAYLSKNPPPDPKTAFEAGFWRGGRWALVQTAALAQERFHNAIIALHELMTGKGVQR